MVSHTKLNFLVNFVLFQALWVAAILGAAKDSMFFAIVIFSLLVIWQSRTGNRNPMDWAFLLILVPLGSVFDSLLAHFQIIQYKVPLPSSNLSPYWIIMLWAGFALSLNHSMSWLLKKPLLALIFGALGGPLSYMAASRLGALSFYDNVYAPMIVSIGWFLVMVVLLTVHNKMRNKDINPVKSEQPSEKIKHV